MAIEIRIDQLRPNNWYLNQEKLERVRAAWREGKGEQLPPVVVTCIDGQWSLVDGHSRAFVAMENGAAKILAVVENEYDLGAPLKLYRQFHAEGPLQGVSFVGDLKDRVLDETAYEEKWISLCRQKMLDL